MSADMMSQMEQLNAELATISISGLAELVKSMRRAQTEFCKTRDKNVLLESKALERQVDAAVEKILQPTGVHREI